MRPLSADAARPAPAGFGQHHLAGDRGGALTFEAILEQVGAHQGPASSGSTALAAPRSPVEMEAGAVALSDPRTGTASAPVAQLLLEVSARPVGSLPEGSLRRRAASSESIVPMVEDGRHAAGHQHTVREPPIHGADVSLDEPRPASSRAASPGGPAVGIDAPAAGSTQAAPRRTTEVAVGARPTPSNQAAPSRTPDVGTGARLEAFSTTATVQAATTDPAPPSLPSPTSPSRPQAVVLGPGRLEPATEKARASAGGDPDQATKAPLPLAPGRVVEPDRGAPGWPTPASVDASPSERPHTGPGRASHELSPFGPAHAAENPAPLASVGLGLDVPSPERPTSASVETSLSPPSWPSHPRPVTTGPVRLEPGPSPADEVPPSSLEGLEGLALTRGPGAPRPPQPSHHPAGADSPPLSQDGAGAAPLSPLLSSPRTRRLDDAPTLPPVPEARAEAGPVDLRRRLGEAEAVAATFAAQPAPPSLGRPLQLFDTKVADLKGAVAQRAADGVVASARTPLNPQRLTGTAVPPADRAGKAQVEAPRPAELDERRRARAEDLPGPTVGLQRAVAALELAGPVLPLPPAIPQAFEALLPQLLDDSSLRMVLGPTLARVSVDTGDLGQLSLQLRVRDGVTEIRAGGPAAPNLEQKQNELRVALASEGLSLGHFDLAQSHSQQRQDRPDVPDRETPPPPPAPRPGASTSDEAAVEGRVHVKA